MVGKIFSHTMIKDENGKIFKFYEKHDFKEGDEVTFELYSGEACNVKLLNEKVSNDTLLHIRNYINNHPKDKSIDLKKSQFSREHEKTNESEKFKKLETLDSGFYELKKIMQMRYSLQKSQLVLLKLALLDFLHLCGFWI